VADASGAGVQLVDPSGAVLATSSATLVADSVIELGHGRGLAVTSSGAVVELDGPGRRIAVVPGLSAPTATLLNRDVIGGGVRFTVAQLGDQAWLVDLEAATAASLSAVAGSGRKVQGWRFSPDEKWVATSGTFLALVPTDSPQNVVQLSSGFGCVAFHPDGRMMVSDSSGAIGSVWITSPEHLDKKDPLFAGASKCAVFFGDRMLAYGLGGLEELTGGGKSTELLSVGGGMVVSLPVPGHPELVSVSGGVSPNDWYLLAGSAPPVKIAAAEGSTWLDSTGGVDAFEREQQQGFELIVARDPTDATVTSWPDHRTGRRLLDAGGRSYLDDVALHRTLTIAPDGQATPLANDQAGHLLSPERSALALASTTGCTIGGLDGAATATIGPCTLLAWLPG